MGIIYQQNTTFSIWNKKQKKVALILNWTDCMHSSIKLVNGILKSKTLVTVVNQLSTGVNYQISIIGIQSACSSFG